MAYKRKSSYAKKSKRPIKKRKAGKKSSFAAKVKKVVMKVSETKRLAVSWNKVEIYHNVLSITQMLGLNGASVMPSVNVTQNGRIGDQINVLGWHLRILCGQKADRPNCTWRYFAVQFPGTVSLTGTGLPYNNVFENVTANVLLDDIQKDTCKVLCTGYWKPNMDVSSGTGGDEFTFCKRLFIPHKKLYKFGPNDSQLTHNQHPIYFFVVVYDAYGSLISDNIAYFQTYSKLVYKDV